MGSESTFTILPREETILLYADFGTLKSPWADRIAAQRFGNLLRSGFGGQWRIFSTQRSLLWSGHISWELVRLRSRGELRQESLVLAWTSPPTLDVHGVGFAPSKPSATNLNQLYQVQWVESGTELLLN